MSRLINYYGSWDKPVPEHTGGTPVSLDCDTVVIGGGGAGLSAAVRAAELGDRVIVLEKMTELGGNTRLAGGLLCLGSQVMAARGVPDMTEEHIDEYRRHHMYRLDSAIYEKFLRQTGRYFDWLAEKGLDVENTRVVMNKVIMVRERKTWEPLFNPQYGPGLMGSAVTDLLTGLANQSDGVEILMPVCAKSLICDDDGAVCGVRAVGGGKDYTVRAKRVILASGGFGADAKLLKHYFPQYFSSDNYFSHYCLKHCTGDGIPMAEAIGARTGENMSIGLEAMNHIPGAYILQRMIQEPAGLVVNSLGCRFLPEDDMPNGEYVLDKQPKGLAWYILSEKTKKEIYELAVNHARYGDWMPEYGQVDIDIAAELKLGLVLKGESPEELEKAMGAPSGALKKTLAQYRRFCDEGHDAQFCKAPVHLLDPGTDGPWYAVRLTRKFDVTMGGVSIDARCRALRPDGSPIRGLYVCGDIASNWMGEDYGPLFSSFAWAVNSGFIAAEDEREKTDHE